MIVPTANYPTSRDYCQLWELAHTAAVVCIVDMDHGKPDTCRDIARTVHSPEWSPELVQVGSRGIGHVWAESLEAFIAGCEQCNLEWLVPPAALAQSKPQGLPPNYIDREHAGADRHLLDVFYQACQSEGGTADEIDLRGLRAVLAARPPAPPAPEVGGGSSRLRCT